MGSYAKAMMRVKREAADTANAAMVKKMKKQDKQHAKVARAGPEPMGSVADLLLAKKIDKQIKKNEKAEGRIYNRVLLDAGIKSLGRLAANYTLATEGLIYLREKLLQKKENSWKQEQRKAVTRAKTKRKQKPHYTYSLHLASF